MERLQELEYRLKDLENEKRIIIEDYLVRLLDKESKKDIPHLMGVMALLKHENIIKFLNDLTSLTKED